MVYRGRVENGAIRLEDSVILPEGAEVRVEMVVSGRGDAKTRGPTVKGDLREETEIIVEPLSRGGKEREPVTRGTVGRALLRLAGKAKGLPPDAARNVDHYLYGHAKR